MAKHKDQHWMLPITRLHIATCVLLFLGAFTRGKLSLERGCLSFDWLKKKKKSFTKTNFAVVHIAVYIHVLLIFMKRLTLLMFHLI